MSLAPVASFEEQWPDLAQRLSRFLARKGVPACDRDDIVQETGLRLFRMWDDVHPHASAWPLVVTIALNLLRDAARRPRHEALEVVIDLNSEPNATDDVERSGLARFELDRVQKSLAEMPPAYRSALLAELGHARRVRGPEPSSNKMLRMRARRALRKLLEQTSLKGGVLGLRLRGMSELLERAAGGVGSTSLAEGSRMTAAAGLFTALAMMTPISAPEGGSSTGTTRAEPGGAPSTAGALPHVSVDGSDTTLASSRLAIRSAGAAGSERRSAPGARTDERAARRTHAERGHRTSQDDPSMLPDLDGGGGEGVPTLPPLPPLALATGGSGSASHPRTASDATGDDVLRRRSATLTKHGRRLLAPSNH